MDNSAINYQKLENVKSWLIHMDRHRRNSMYGASPIGKGNVIPKILTSLEGKDLTKDENISFLTMFDYITPCATDHLRIVDEGLAKQLKAINEKFDINLSIKASNKPFSDLTTPAILILDSLTMHEFKIEEPVCDTTPYWVLRDKHRKEKKAKQTAYKEKFFSKRSQKKEVKINPLLAKLVVNK